MRHLPFITYHLGHVFTLQPRRHPHRRLLLAGRRDVIAGVTVRRRSRNHGLLRHSDVVCHATGAEGGSLCGARGDNGIGSPGCLYLDHRVTIYRSACFTGKRSLCFTLNTKIIKLLWLGLLFGRPNWTLSVCLSVHPSVSLSSRPSRISF